MRILAADSLDSFAVDALTASGHQVVVDPAITAATLAEHLDGVQVLIVRSTVVGAQALAAGRALRLVVRAGAGTDTIDTAAAAGAGVFVANVPGRNSVAVAELTMGLILASDRRIADNVIAARAGQWDKTGFSKARGLLGTRLGIVGLGDIGLAVAERAAAFGMHVYAASRPGRAPATAARIQSVPVTEVADLPTLAGGCDVVSVHVPGGPGTVGLIDAAFLRAMPDGALVVNTSRGDVLDEAALVAELDAGRLRAAVDVYAAEPKSGSGPWDSPLARHPAVVATHHIGASTLQAQQAVAAGVVDVVDAFSRGRVLNCVNLASAPLGVVTLTVRHYDEVGVLASVLARLSHAGLNVEQMDNQVFSGAKAAVATLSLAGRPGEDVIAALQALPHVIEVTVQTQDRPT